MDQGLVTVIGMSIAYVASLIGMGLAWWAWRRRADEPDGDSGRTGGAGGAGARGEASARGGPSARGGASAPGGTTAPGEPTLAGEPGEGRSTDRDQEDTP